MKLRTLLLPAVALTCLVLVSQGWGQSQGWGREHGLHYSQAQNESGMSMMGQGTGSMQRHRQAMRQGIPEPYASLPQPAGDRQQIARGRELYATHCAACHGSDGRGDGPGAASLEPAPANLRRLTSMQLGRLPGYLAFAIGEGGAAYGTAMPAYKDTLDVEQRQALVAFLQHGL